MVTMREVAFVTTVNTTPLVSTAKNVPQDIIGLMESSLMIPMLARVSTQPKTTMIT